MSRKATVPHLSAADIEVPLDTIGKLGSPTTVFRSFTPKVTKVEVETPVKALTPAAAPAPAPKKPAAVAAKPAPVEKPVVASTDGITEEGRATNDPRVDAKPVAQLNIETGHPTLFGDTVAPAVVPSGKKPPRSSNDPRGNRAASEAVQTTEPS